MMRTISNVVLYVVLGCLLLSWGVGNPRPFRRTHAHNRNSRPCHRVLAHLRRCRGDNSTHHPVRPCKNAVLPPDDDRIDPERSHTKSNPQSFFASAQEAIPRCLSAAFGSRPLPTEVPRHQTLCILLI